MSKKSTFRYQPLYDFLKKSTNLEIELTSQQIEKICGFKLPKSAEISSWWSNTPENGHSQAKAWKEAGYRVTASGDKKIFRKC